MFSVLVIRLRSLRLLRVSGIVMRLRSEERFSRNAETDLVCRLLLEKKSQLHSAFFPTCTVGFPQNSFLKRRQDESCRWFVDGLHQHEDAARVTFSLHASCCDRYASTLIAIRSSLSA